MISILGMRKKEKRGPAPTDEEFYQLLREYPAYQWGTRRNNWTDGEDVAHGESRAEAA